METIKTYLRVDRSKISYLRFILEAYDGICGLTTLDPKLGIVMLCISPGCLSEVDLLLHDLKKELIIEKLETPEW